MNRYCLVFRVVGTILGPQGVMHVPFGELEWPLAGHQTGHVGSATQPTLIVGDETCDRVHESTLQVVWSCGCHVGGPLVTAPSGVVVAGCIGPQHSGVRHNHSMNVKYVLASLSHA
jgi:hypothetical protein